MAQIGPGIPLAHRALALRIDGAVVQLVLGVFDVDDTLGSEQMSVTGIAGGHDAVEKVHAPGYPFDDVGGRTHSHEIPGLVRRHMGVQLLDDLVHHFGGLPYGQAADGIARQIQLSNLLHVLNAQIGISAALVDAEEHLAGVDGVLLLLEPVQLLFAPLQPADGAGDGGLHIVIGGRVFDALIKGHGNVAAQIPLDMHALFRAHKDPVTIGVSGKAHPLFGDLPQSGQGENLEPAAVCEDGAIPPHEFVQSSHLTDHIIPGTHMKMVGVGQLHLAADIPQVLGRQPAFDGGLGAHIHKNRGLDGAMRTGKFAPTGPPLLLDYFKHDLLLQWIRILPGFRRAIPLPAMCAGSAGCAHPPACPALRWPGSAASGPLPAPERI